MVARYAPHTTPEYTPEALADQVDWSNLPGVENLNVNGAFNMFAGYINIDEENGRRIFYWFMEAQDNAEEAPLVRRKIAVVFVACVGLV